MLYGEKAGWEKGFTGEGAGGFLQGSLAAPAPGSPVSRSPPQTKKPRRQLIFSVAYAAIIISTYLFQLFYVNFF